jgi:hypothetical protein
MHRSGLIELEVVMAVLRREAFVPQPGAGDVGNGGQ